MMIWQLLILEENVKSWHLTRQIPTRVKVVLISEKLIYMIFI